MVVVCSFLAVVVMAVLGYTRGAIRMLASLLALLVAGLLSFPLGGLGGALVRLTGLVPRSLLSLAGPLFIGLLLFVLMVIPMEIALGRRQKGREKEGLPNRASWEGPVGALLGGVWGFLLTILVLTGIAIISHVQTAMRQANAEVAERADRRRKEDLRVNRIARLTRQHPTYAVNLRLELEEVDQSTLKLEAPSQIEEIASQISSAPFLGEIVEKTNPVDRRSQKMLRDLTVVVGDPVLFDRFQNHPRIAEMTKDPTMQALSQDPEIAQLVREGKFRELLDNAKLSDVAQNKELAARLKALELENVLREVKSQTVEVKKGI